MNHKYSQDILIINLSKYYNSIHWVLGAWCSERSRVIPEHLFHDRTQFDILFSRQTSSGMRRAWLSPRETFLVVWSIMKFWPTVKLPHLPDLSEHSIIRDHHILCLSPILDDISTNYSFHRMGSTDFYIYLVMISSNFVARVASFGLAKYKLTSHVTTGPLTSPCSNWLMNW